MVFTAHSIPIAASSRCGTDLYARQVAYAARLVADAAGYDDYDQVWQSRSGPPRVPWLEPDVGDHLAALADSGVTAVIVCPIGFVADHIEVVWDLDHELRLQAEEAGMAFARAATPNADLARVVADLLDELRTDRDPVRLLSPDSPPLQGFSVNGALCTLDAYRAGAFGVSPRTRVCAHSGVQGHRHSKEFRDETDMTIAPHRR